MILPVQAYRPPGGGAMNPCTANEVPGSPAVLFGNHVPVWFREYMSQNLPGHAGLGVLTSDIRRKSMFGLLSPRFSSACSP